MNNSGVKIKYEDELLYYYTSLNTLQTILQKKTVRLTDYRFLNDTQELLFATGELKEYLTKNAEGEKTEKILAAVRNVENGKIQNLISTGKLGDKIILSPALLDTCYYVISLSKSRDDLTMWKMYAPEGCCLKFNSQKFFEFFDSFHLKHFKNGLLNIIRGEVSYGHDSLVPPMAQFMSKYYNGIMLYYYIMVCCLLIKDKPFEYEQEYRVAIPFTEEYLDDSCSREFIIRDTMVKPQIELKEFPVADILEEVIISPFIKSEITHLGIQELLKAHKILPDIVHKSDILIR